MGAGERVAAGAREVFNCVRPSISDILFLRFVPLLEAIMHKAKLKNAWLLTWIGTNELSQDQDRQIIAIMPSKTSSSKIHNLVVFLYRRSVNTAFGMASSGGKRSSNGSDYSHRDNAVHRVFYGQNPWVFARLVGNLRVEYEDNCDVEHVYWTELAYMRPDKPGAMPTVVTAASEEHIVRKVRQLLFDIFQH